jgi:hypothetical protein
MGWVEYEESEDKKEGKEVARCRIYTEIGEISIILSLS